MSILLKEYHSSIITHTDYYQEYSAVKYVKYTPICSNWRIWPISDPRTITNH